MAHVYIPDPGAIFRLYPGIESRHIFSCHWLFVPGMEQKRVAKGFPVSIFHSVVAGVGVGLPAVILFPATALISP